MVEKTATKSKKFMAFLLVEIGFFILMGMMVLRDSAGSLGGNMAFMTLSLSSAFLAVGYILGQAYIDKFLAMTTYMQLSGPSE